MQVATEIKSNPPGQPIDRLKLQRRILASEPPFASDLEAQIAFCEVWGGGEEQERTQDICNFIKLSDTSFRITAAFFQACASLKPDPLRMPIYFISACCKMQATRGSGRDGAGNAIGSKDIKRIATDLAERCTEANDVTMRGHVICQRITGIDSARLAKLRGEFECDAAAMVFKPPAAGTSFDTCVNKFLESVQPRHAGDEPSQAKPSPTETLTVINALDEDLAKSVLSRLGIFAGTTLEQKTGSTAGNQWQVEYVNDDGSIGVRAIGADGTCSDQEITVVARDKVSGYAVVKETRRIKLLQLAELQPDVFGQDVYKQMIANFGIAAAYHQHKVSPDMIHIQGQPKIRVLSRRTLKAGSLIMVPWTLNVSPRKPTDKSSATIDVMMDAPSSFALKPPAGLGKSIEVEYWRLQPATHDKDANMRLTTIDVLVNYPIDFGEGETVNVRMTVATNFKKVDAGVELKLKSAAADSNDLKVGSASAGSDSGSAKRRKTSSTSA